MEAHLEPVRRRALDELTRHFAAGHLRAETLEQRVADVLRAATDDEVSRATWDLPRLAPGMLDRLRRAAGLPAPARRCSRLYVDGPRPAVLDLAAGPRTWLLGRALDCELVLAAPDVSRRHAELSVRGGQCAIRDLASRHGVRVNGRRVLVAVLRPGDVVVLGGEAAVTVR